MHRAKKKLFMAVFLDSSLLHVRAGDLEAIRSRRRSPAVPILAGACFGSGGHGDRGVRWPVYIFPSTLVDLGRVCLVSSSALRPIGEFGSSISSLEEVTPG